MRAVVTGGAGFLGSHLCEFLLKQGWQVVSVDNLITGSETNLAGLRQQPGFEAIKQNISEGLDVSGPVDYVLNFASPASPPDYLKYPVETMLVGSQGTLHALELAKAKKAKFLQASTSECYGDPEVNPQPESYWGHVNSVGPRSVYDEAKRFSEALTMAFHRYHGVDTRIVRIFNTYGPRMRLNDGRALPNFLYQALTGQSITVYGDGSQTRSFCFVSDLIEGIFGLMGSAEHMPVNVGNPREITIMEFAERIKALTGADVPIIFESLPVDDPKQRRPDITKARSLFGWEPKISLEEGLDRTLRYFQQEVKARMAAAK
jgi:dTDP-glucose 4,6-dehydratase